MKPPLRYTSRQPRAEQLRALYQQAPWARHRRLPAIRRALKHSDLFFCAWRGSALVGFCRLSTDFAFRAVLWDVIVDPSEHGHGIGSTLVQKVLKHPRLKSVEGIWLYTTDKQGFYRRFGFKAFPENLMIFKRPLPKR